MISAGNTAFLLIAVTFVFLMTPGLAFFYGGLSRRKNVLNTMMSSIFIIGLASLMWVMIGYSLSFSGDNGGIIGTLQAVGLKGIGADPGEYSDSLPALLFAAFQMMFAIITPALITGAVAGRMKFKALFLFIAVWSVIVYYPMAHMVWGAGGFLAEIGSVDFAGGNVVHISSGVSGLVLAMILGKRSGYGQISVRPHNVPFVVLGAFLLWFGWFGFNAGSASGGGRTRGTRADDDKYFCGGRYALLDAHRRDQDGASDCDRRVHRRRDRFGGDHTGSRICSGMELCHHRSDCQPDLLFRSGCFKEKVRL